MIGSITICLSWFQNVWCRRPKIRKKEMDSLFWRSHCHYIYFCHEWIWFMSCWRSRGGKFVCIDIENTRWVSFDFKFTRQGFENACWHREACRAIQHAFSKPCLVNMILKYANLVFYFSDFQVDSLFKLANTTKWSIFSIDLAISATTLKRCNVIMT